MAQILIVEDDLAHLYALRTLFEREGWQVSESRTLAGALAQLDPPPDWIILDLGLADGDGEVLLDHVRGAGLPSRVAVVSSKLDAERIARLQPLKPEAILEKPVPFETLRKVCGVAVRSGPMGNPLPPAGFVDDQGWGNGHERVPGDGPQRDR